jgi:hypothetical protein
MSLLLCTICEHPAVGICPLTRKHLCSSICQNINYSRQLIAGKTKRDDAAEKKDDDDPNERDKKKGKGKRRRRR